MILETGMVQQHLSAVWKDWKIAGKLGNGTYGAVYEIYRNDLQNGKTGNILTGALKVLYLESFEDGRTQGEERHLYTFSDTLIEEFVKNVSTEIRAMIRLKGHPNVVSIEDYHVSRNDHSCLIMIRMEKLNCLANSIREGTQAMSREGVIGLGIDICKALESCESQNIIHRDIKPSNIFYGDRTGFKLGDFGISRTMEHVYMSASMSGAGTPPYMAPEVYTGRAYNNKADIYSLGIVLYQLMNDSFLPFLRVSQQMLDSGSRRHAWMRRMRGEQLPLPARADPRLASVILRACSYYPENRFATAGEFRQALESCLFENYAVTDPAEAVPSLPKPQKAPEKNRTASAVKIAIEILVLAMFFVTGLSIGSRFLNNSGSSSASAENPLPGSGSAETGSTTLSQSDTAAGETPSSAGTAGNGKEKEEEEEEAASAAGGTGKTESPAQTGTSADNGTEKSSDPNEELTFADPALEKAIRANLGLEDDQPITRRIALGTEKLKLGGGGKEDSEKISDLSGLSEFLNLKVLEAPTNNITSLEELAGLTKLEKLLLESNQISDLTPLAGLFRLRTLEIAKNKIEDLSPIYVLDNVELLDVNENQITSIKGIGGMRKINTLRVSKNQITDISPVGELNDLVHLSFGYNQVEDISVLYDLPMMKVLTMNGNKIRDIGPVLQMEELFWLEVAGNPIDDKTVFDRLPDSVTHLEK